MLHPSVRHLGLLAVGIVILIFMRWAFVESGIETLPASCLYASYTKMAFLMAKQFSFLLFSVDMEFRNTLSTIKFLRIFRLCF
jgi:multidrug transporter EmrE-like cation transporter